MGEIADAMINGDMCQHCGEWLGGGAGYPVSCCGELDTYKPKQSTVRQVRRKRQRANRRKREMEKRNGSKSL